MLRIPAAIAVLVAVSACSQKAPPAPAPPQVAVANPLSKNVVDWDEYIGHFEAPQSVELRGRVTGQVTQILFRDGQAVREGQPLFVIDGVPVKNSLSNIGTNKGSNNDVDYGNAISDLNPNDIESVSILKGPSAAALYGSRAGSTASELSIACRRCAA